MARWPFKSKVVPPAPGARKSAEEILDDLGVPFELADNGKEKIAHNRRKSDRAEISAESVLNAARSVN